MLSSSCMSLSIVCIALVSLIPHPSDAYCCGLSKMDVAQADFAFNVLRESGNESVPKSAILSPFSIAVALGRTYVGARGETQTQMNKLLLAPGVKNSEFSKYYKRLFRKLAHSNRYTTLSSANKLYVNKGFVVKPIYLDKTNEMFGANTQKVDFAHAAETAKKINDWVEEETNSKITDLVKASMLTQSTRMMLVNAVYFKGAWRDVFEKENTKKMTFYEAEGKTREVDMMTGSNEYQYHSDENIKMLGMPFAGGEATLFVFLPRKKFGLAEMEIQLTGEGVLSMIGNATPHTVVVELPKFKVEEELRLEDTLKKMGMEDAFSSKANFSGISDEPLFISAVVHKAIIEVNEQGTEASAATAIQIAAVSLPFVDPNPIHFTADYPFLFALVKDKTIIFLGHFY